MDYFESLERLNKCLNYPLIQLIFLRVFFLCFAGGLVYTLIEFSHMKEAISIAFLVTCVSLLAFVLMLKYMRTTRHQRLTQAIQRENDVYCKRSLPSRWDILHGDKAQPTLIIDFMQPSFASFINNSTVTSSYLATQPVYDVMQPGGINTLPPTTPNYTSTTMPPLNLTYLNLGSSVLLPGLISPSAPELTPTSAKQMQRSFSGERKNNICSTSSPPSPTEIKRRRTISPSPQESQPPSSTLPQQAMADLSQPLISRSQDDMV
jgi:hypothetical protein